MGDRTTTIECTRLEDLATIPRSQKQALLNVKENDVGYLNVRVEGHDYLVIKTKQFGVQVSRLDIEDLPLATRFFQTIKEFFTHQVADFFQLRGVGTRSYRIGKAVESWTKMPDGQEKAKGPPTILTPTLTYQTPGEKDHSRPVELRRRPFGKSWHAAGPGNQDLVGSQAFEPQ